MNDDIVTVTCYNQTEQLTRKKAIEQYLLCCSLCDPQSSEYGRYFRIVERLKSGLTIINDEE